MPDSAESSPRRRPTDVLWMHRLFDWGAPRCPHFIEPVLRIAWVLLFFVVAGSQRRAVEGNLLALFPHWGRGRGLLGAWLVFWNFADSLVDAARLRQGEEFCWEVYGGEYCRALEAEPRGLLLATAHMGSYDSAAGAFANRFARRLALVRQGEPDPRIDERRREQVKQDTQGKVRIFYNRGVESQLGLELMRSLHEGDVIAIQGDRALPGLSRRELRAQGLQMQVPTGPWELAAIAKVPIYPLFCWKAGPDRYRIRFGEPFEVATEPGVKRHEAIEASLQRWAGILLQQARTSWAQWYVFEPNLTRVDLAASTERVWSDEGEVPQYDGASYLRRCRWWERTAMALLVGSIGLAAVTLWGWWGLCAAPLLVWVMSLLVSLVWAGLFGLVMRGGADSLRLVRERVWLGILILLSVALMPLATIKVRPDAPRWLFGLALGMGIAGFVWAGLALGPWMRQTGARVAARASTAQGGSA